MHSLKSTYGQTRAHRDLMRGHIMTAMHRLFAACFLLAFMAVPTLAWQDSGGAESSPTVESAPAVSSGGGVPTISYLIPVLGIVGLAFTYWKSSWVAQQEVGTERMAGIAANITEGAMSFLRAEYSILAIFVLAVGLLLGYSGTTQGDASSPLIALSFGLGAICSALAGFVGMKVATKANVRTTNAARSGLGEALEVAFAGGSVMGMGVVGLGVLGLSALFHRLWHDVRPGLHNPASRA